MYSQNNLEELLELIGSYPNHRFRRTAHFDYIQADGFVWPNQLLNLKVGTSTIGAILDQIEELSHTNQIPGFLKCNPVNTSPEILNELNARNYKRGKWTAMSHDLHLSHSFSPSSNFSVLSVSNEDQLQSWLSIVEKELMGKGRLSKALFSNLLQHENCFFFLGLIGDIPVSTSLLFKGSDAAGIYLIATSKKYRRRGIGRDITLFSLEKAKEMNCTKVNIQATDDGKNMYESLGFNGAGEVHVFNISAKVNN